MKDIAFDHWRERLKRWFCSWYGHNWLEDDSGAPAIPMLVFCGRCGKWVHLVRS